MSRRQTPVKAYWWWGNSYADRTYNFGDQLSPLLARRFANVDVEWATVSHSRLVVVGSVLEHIPPLWEGVILGAGKLHEDSRLHLHTGTARVLAVRGPLSARSCPGSSAIGDPGILADHLAPCKEKVYDLGVLPHWTDDQLTNRPEWYSPKWTTRVIDPGGNAIDVVRTIGQCRKIVTSSLHGMIVADAFGIPRRVEPNKMMDQDGGYFKFRDYSEGLGVKFEPHRLVQAPRFNVERQQHELKDAFRALAALVG